MGDLDGARSYLTRFVGMYHNDDGFHRTARRVLASLEHAEDPACDAKATLATDPEGRRIAQRCKTSAPSAQRRAQK